MATRRELIEPQKGDKRYVRRNKKGIQGQRGCRSLAHSGSPPQGQDYRASKVRVTVATAASADEASFGADFGKLNVASVRGSVRRPVLSRVKGRKQC